MWNEITRDIKYGALRYVCRNVDCLVPECIASLFTYSSNSIEIGPNIPGITLFSRAINVSHCKL